MPTEQTAYFILYLDIFLFLNDQKIDLQRFGVQIVDYRDKRIRWARAYMAEIPVREIKETGIKRPAQTD